MVIEQSLTHGYPFYLNVDKLRVIRLLTKLLELVQHVKCFPTDLI